MPKHPSRLRPRRLPPAGLRRGGGANEPRRGTRQGKPKRSALPRPCPVRGAPGRGEGRASRTSKRLSATDISALASMKNVAKCDTWCELQNPVNHRVFERKLRPKPSGRGHACLGVTHRVAPPPHRSRWSGRVRGAETGLPCAPVARPAQMRSPGSASRDQWWLNPQLACCQSRGRASSGRASRATQSAPRRFRPRPQVRRDYPLSLSISISGGKETYKDSPSNGERTGNSPT